MLNEFFSEFKFEDFGIDLPNFSEALDEMEDSSLEPELPIVPKYSEKYTSFVIVCDNEIDENHIAEKLGIAIGKCYKSSSVGPMHIIKSSQLIKTWK